MNPFEKIFDYVDEQPKTVAVILLGVIVVGIIGGGLWIKNLQTTIQQQDKTIAEIKKLYDERSQLQNDRYQSEIQKAKQISATLSEAFEQMKEGTNSYTSIANSITKTLYSVLETEELNDTNKQNISEIITLISFLSEKITDATNRVEMLEQLVSRLQKVETIKGLMESIEPYRRYRDPVYIILGISLGITVLISVIIIEKERQKIKQLNKIIQQQHKQGGPQTSNSDA